jgi:hypothetical protein
MQHPEVSSAVRHIYIYMTLGGNGLNYQCVCVCVCACLTHVIFVSAPIARYSAVVVDESLDYTIR